MSIVSKLFEKRAHPSNPSQWLLDLGLKPTASGVEVTTEGSLSSVAVYACVRILAETVASLPLIVYERQGKGKDRAVKHPLYTLLHDLPNKEMTSFELRETLMGHVALWGNAYAEIEYNKAGRIIGLWPLRPDKVEVKRVNGQLIYYVKVNAETIPLAKQQVLHLRGLGSDGVKGYSPITLARQAIGLTLATEEFGARFFGNGARPGLILEHPGQLSETAQGRLKAAIGREHQGLSNAHRLMVLEEGMKVHEVGIPPEDAQFLETRKFQTTEIARLYRIPPHMLADLERATFSNIEHQSIEFVTHTIRPWLVRWEQAINRDLLLPTERSTYFAEHLIDGLLRGDIASRYQAYSIGRQNGWLSANDIREKENMNPIEGGDVYLIPLNMIPADEAEQQLDTEQPNDETQKSLETRALQIENRAQNLAASRRRLANSFQRLLKDTTDRIYRREIADVGRAITKYFGKRDANDFSVWLREFYNEHKEFWIKQIKPILLSYADQVGVSVANELDIAPGQSIDDFIEQYAEALANREAGSSHLQLQALLDEALTNGEDPTEKLQGRLNEWGEKRSDKTSLSEAYSILGAFTLAFYVAYRVTRKRWVSTGENCPYCSNLNGKVIEVQKFFLDKDTDFQPEGAESPISIRFSAGHPPLHGGCDCVIVAERN
jgi:HK97 family phage portal protein